MSHFMEETPDSVFEQLLVENLDLIERLIRFICRNKLDPAEVEEFSAWVKLRLVDHHYAILRKFERRCSLPTYLTVVIKRLFSDYQIHLHGKWHTSAKALQTGTWAVDLERLLHRDRKTLDEAIAILQTAEGAPSRAELEKLAAQLPPRPVRASFVNADDVAQDLAVSEEATEAGAMAGDRQVTVNKITKTMRASLAALTSEDLSILRMVFVQEMTVADIARALHVEQKPLYRRIEAIRKSLRKQLVSAGIRSSDADDIVGHHDTRLDFGLLGMGKPATRSSSNNGSGPGDVREPR